MALINTCERLREYLNFTAMLANDDMVMIGVFDRNECIARIGLREMDG